MRMNIYVMLLSVSIFIGASFNLASYAVHFFSAPAAAAWRFGLAACLILLLLFVKERLNMPAWRSNWPMFVLLGILGVFGFNMLFFEGMKTTSPLNGALIMATNPLVSALLACFLIKDTLSARQVIGIFFSLLGVLLVITQGSWQVISTLSFSGGDLCILGGNLCWALYGVLNRRYIRGSSSLATTAYTMTVGALCLIAVSWSAPSPVPVFDIPAAAWGAIAFMAVFTSVLGYLWWNDGIARIGVSRTSIFFNLVPLVTMLLSYAAGTHITGVQLVGTAMVIMGVVVASAWSRTAVRTGTPPLTAKGSPR
ncbi:MULTISPECIES: DMT family transporter [Paenibacillus]|uniref:DMT family transporter n=1 Tax=Paenibacillus TaxID=44249 RepID=UPI0022B8719D|nr:DMT family transporter [Paenibacillus caseinilyticus]MCZ8519627.1 DMT family transporter [Paenibacillus caseinilyticus]